MTKYDIREHLLTKGFSTAIAERVKGLVEQAGGCDAFLAMAETEITRLYNESHDSKYGLGHNTYEAIRAAKNHIRGVSDEARAEKKAADDAAARKNAEISEIKEQIQRGFDSEPLEIQALQEVVMSDLLKGMTVITIGQLKFLLSMKRGGVK